MLKDQKLILAIKLSKYSMEVKDKTPIETILLDITFLRECTSA